jgi:general transcription factor 3C polypeptide 3 (transcription factor C subunit 4)
MFPRNRPSKANNEAEQDRMVSRLHLDLGSYLPTSVLDMNLPGAEHDGILRKAKGKNVDSGRIDVFRGVHFDDWLRVFMQVRFS